MAHLPLYRTCVEGRRLQRELCRHRHQGTVSHIQFLISNHVLPIGYVDLHRHSFAR
jgi:hypothetical protein